MSPIRAPYLITATNRTPRNLSGAGEKYVDYPDREFFDRNEAQSTFDTLVKDGDFKIVQFFDQGKLLAMSENV